MDIATYVDRLRQQFATAAEAGGEETRAVAERLAAPLDSAVRLTLLEALSAAADEITRDLAPGSVDLRLRAGEPGFVVTPPPAEQVASAPASAAPPVAPPVADEGATSRINFRPPEQLKLRIEEAANREGLSVNAWLIRAVTRVLEPEPARQPRAEPSVGQRFSGWVR